ncbi:hypothetical protein [Hymenobacter seoulensis]
MVRPLLPYHLPFTLRGQWAAFPFSGLGHVAFLGIVLRIDEYHVGKTDVFDFILAMDRRLLGCG